MHSRVGQESMSFMQGCIQHW